MTRFVCVADLHENLVEVPPCDVLVIAGDISFACKGDLAAKQSYLVGPFSDWLDRVDGATIPRLAADVASDRLTALAGHDMRQSCPSPIPIRVPA